MTKKIRLLVACLGVLLSCGGCGLQVALDELGSAAEIAGRDFPIVEYAADGGVPESDAGIPVDAAVELEDGGVPSAP